jgi:hypothetical protein
MSKGHKHRYDYELEHRWAHIELQRQFVILILILLMYSDSIKPINNRIIYSIKVCTVIVCSLVMSVFAVHEDVWFSDCRGVSNPSLSYSIDLVCVVTVSITIHLLVHCFVLVIVISY